MVFRGRDLLVRQRTQISNALCGHMTEYGWIAPRACLIRRTARGSLGRSAGCTIGLHASAQQNGHARLADRRASWDAARSTQDRFGEHRLRSLTNYINFSIG